MNRNTLVLAMAATLTIGLTGCGGGGGGTSSAPTGTLFHAFVPLTDNPATFQCSTAASITGMFSVGGYNTEADCNVSAQAWLNAYNQNDAPATVEQQTGLDWLNTIRQNVGLPVFKHNAKLERATANHENYLDDVEDTYGVNMGHYEDNDNYPSVHYTGVYPTDRAHYEGYAGYYAGDVISYQQNSTVWDSLDELMSAIYHRQALLWNFTHEIGIGGVQHNYNYQSQPHLMGVKMETETFLSAISAELVAYPYDGETDVRTVFYEETPDPLPDYSTTGNPISVSFNSYYVSSVTMVSFKLFNDDTNTEITNVRLMDADNDPNGRFGALDFALFPLDVLDNSTTYRVEIEYVQDGVSKSKVWRFTTRA